MARNIAFFVAGIPVHKGSAKGFVVKNKVTGKSRAIITQDNRKDQLPWASAIAVGAQQHHQGDLYRGPVKLSLWFVFPRPKSHYGTGKNKDVVRSTASMHHIIKPDMDKLLRCVKDALTAVVWVDDCQVCEYGRMGKSYGEKPGVYVTIDEL